MVVGPDTPWCVISDFIEVLPAILRQPLAAYGPVEALDINIQLRLIRLDVSEGNTSFLSPVLDRSADVLGSVVTSASPRDAWSSPHFDRT